MGPGDTEAGGQFSDRLHGSNFFSLCPAKRVCPVWSAWLVSVLTGAGLHIPEYVVGSVLFFLWILVFQIGYYSMVLFQSWYAKIDKNLLLPLFGYGCIPLILGGYMAVHLDAFVRGAGRIVPNLQETVWAGNIPMTIFD